ncbi:MAG: transposase [Firmicutes bacterium]|nr:transposase [Bacillota bacterium]MTI81457.1 transposase [Bacillota bacterium]
MKLPKRKSNRLIGYDYSQYGAYFITICIKDRKKLLWQNVVGATFGRPIETSLSSIGKIVDTEIAKISDVYKNVTIKKYVIMPNHIHMIIVLQPDEGRRPQVAPTISRIIQQFKGSISKKLGFSIWQKSYYDHIIRNETEYQKIWEYIDTNPLKWEHDKYYT